MCLGIAGVVAMLRTDTRETHMISWEMATILVLLAYILGLMTAIRLLKS